MFKTYYTLTKPGIIYGNIITAAGGFFLASRGNIDIWLLIATIIGSSLVIASACVMNNYIDRDIDGKMARTRTRALVLKTVPVQKAILYAVLLGIAGTAILALYTNLLTAAIGLTGFFFYVVVYGFWKRRSIHGTLIGCISGAIPPVAGYCAVTNRIDLGAVILFFIMVCWQMPHFYAIAIYRLHDYVAAGIPVLPAKKGISATKIQMLWYTLGFITVSSILAVVGYTGYAYMIVMTITGCLWLRLCILGFTATNNIQWARKVFRFSLIVIMVFSLTLSLTLALP